MANQVIRPDIAHAGAPKGGITIRLADLPDLSEVKEIADNPQVTRASRWAKVPELESAIDREQLFVAEVDGWVAGFLEGNIKTGRIWFIAVHPDFQGRGVGSALVMEFSRDADIVTTNVTMDSIGFWQKLGFKQVGDPVRKRKKQTVKMIKWVKQKALGSDENG